MSEILGSLFKNIVALLAVAAVSLILYQVFGVNKTSDAISYLTQLQANITGLYNSQSNYTTLTNTVAINAKLAPKSMISGTNLVNPWGGSVTVTVNAINSSEFDVTEGAVPADACTKMLVSMPSVVALTVNAAAQTTLPIDAGTASAACSLASNSITFTFGK